MNKNFFKNKSLLITGSTGSFGKSLVDYLLKNKFPLKKIVIFSRDELKQFEMSKVYDPNKHKQLRYFIGDIRDLSRLKLALRDIDFLIHAAALKHVPIAEYNPLEFIKTNIHGAQNIIEASLESKISNIVALSTDKASSPINLYGATKLCSDKLFISANNIVGKQNIKFSIVRYGNVMGSRGSVLHTFLDQKRTGQITITHKDMTRFNITLQECVERVLKTLENSLGGEIFVPKIPSFKITDLAKAICPSCKIKIIGIRPGEKLHEEMVSSYDSHTTIKEKNGYKIVSQDFLKKHKNKKFIMVAKNFVYRSDTNENFLGVNQLKKIIKKYNLIA
jgi:UDP-N-acetylglucosamine 4,6-dehydratase (inverting)